MSAAAPLTGIMPYLSQGHGAVRCSLGVQRGREQWVCATCPRGMRVCDSAGVIHSSSARVCMRYAYTFRVLCVDVARCSLFNFMIYLFQRETIYYYNQAFKSQHGNTVFLNPGAPGPLHAPRGPRACRGAHVLIESRKVSRLEHRVTESYGTLRLHRTSGGKHVHPSFKVK